MAQYSYSYVGTRDIAIAERISMRQIIMFYIGGFVYIVFTKMLH